MQDFPFLNAGFPFLHAGFTFLNAGVRFLHAGIFFLNAGFPSLNAGFPLLECRISLFECRSSLFENRICPRIFQDFGRYPSTCFLAITCTIWLRLEFRDRGSAWFFSAHLSFFHAQGRIFEPRIGFWIPRSTFWPGDLFGVKNGSRKSVFATESFCHGSSVAIPKPK